MPLSHFCLSTIGYIKIMKIVNIPIIIWSEKKKKKKLLKTMIYDHTL